MKAAKRWRTHPDLLGVRCPCGRPVGTFADLLRDLGLDTPIHHAIVDLETGEMGPHLDYVPNSQPRTCPRHEFIDPALLAESILDRTFSESDLSKRDAARADAFASGNPEGVSPEPPAVPDLFVKGMRKSKKGGAR
jgi:hypothetical protein